MNKIIYHYNVTVEPEIVELYERTYQYELDGYHLSILIKDMILERCNDFIDRTDRKYPNL